MQELPLKKESVEALIDELKPQCPPGFVQLPQNIINEISLRPECIISFIRCLKGWDRPVSDARTELLFRLIDEALCHVRYSIDRKDKKGRLLFEQIQDVLNHVMPFVLFELRSTFNQVLFDSKLMFELRESNGSDVGGRKIDAVPDIMPKLPELLDSLRREKVFKTTFELYELMLSQMHLMSADEQLSLIAEMAHSKKPIAHELAVLMLLHPKPTIRKKIADVICLLSDERIFTPVDLRRLIMIRNWVPSDERAGIDSIISNLRKSKLSTAPYPVTKLTKLVGSSMDGAGVCFIMMEVKKNNQRQIAGFLAKIDVGIREPYVMHKAPKHYIEDIINGHGGSNLPVRPVSKAYVNKIVSHFLSETIGSGKVPEAIFIEVAELFGADGWQPQPLIWSDEMTRLRQIYADKLDNTSINQSLKLSAGWHLREEIANSWFETGDVARQVMIEIGKKYNDRTEALDAFAAECLMEQCFDKWKTIFLVTCLWMRTKDVHDLCADLFTVLHCIDNKMAPSDIPLICNAASQTLAALARREME